LGNGAWAGAGWGWREGLLAFLYTEGERKADAWGREIETREKKGEKDLRGIMPAGMPLAMPNGGGGTPPIGELLVCVLQELLLFECSPAAKLKGGGGKGCTPGFWPSIGFEEDWPSAA
jgi:hypothetical protein